MIVSVLLTLPCITACMLVILHSLPRGASMFVSFPSTINDDILVSPHTVACAASYAITRCGHDTSYAGMALMTLLEHLYTPGGLDGPRYDTDVRLCMYHLPDPRPLPDVLVLLLASCE